MMRSIFGIFLVLLMAMPHGFAQLNSYSRAELAFDNALTGYNPGFESGTVKWTASGGTFVVNSGTQFITGSKQFASWDSNSASQEVCSSLVKVPESGNCAVSLTYKVPSGTATHKIVAKDGSKDLSVEDVVSSTAAWRHDVEFPCAAAASNQARVCLRSVASNEPAIQLDGGYAGHSRTVGQCGVDTPWTAYTPVVTAISGSLTNYTVYGEHRKNGDSADFRYRLVFTGAVGTWQQPIFSLPSGMTVDATKIPGGDVLKFRSFNAGSLFDDSTGTSYQATGTIYTATTLLVNLPSVATHTGTVPVQPTGITQAVPFSWATSDEIRFEVHGVPIVGWTASQCVTPEQQRAPKVTVYTSGSGTHTWSNGVTYAEIEMVGGGGGGAGSGTASGGSGGAGGNTTFAGLLTANGGAGGVVGTGLSSGGAVTVTSPAVQLMAIAGANGGGTQYDNLAAGNSGGAGASSCRGGAGGQASYSSPGFSAKANSGSGGGGAAANAAVGGSYTGQGGAAGGCIRAQIIAPSGTAAYAVGAAGSAGSAGTNGYVGGAGGSGEIIVTEYFGYTTAILANSVSSSVTNGARMIWASVKSVCSSNPCTIGAQSGDFTSITRAGTGGYQANFKAGTFSGTPVCTCSTVGALDGTCSAYNSTTSSSTVRTYTPTGSAQDGYIEMMCIGPR